MSAPLDSKVVALSLFHLCSCNIASICFYSFLVQSKVTEQIKLRRENVMVCPTQQLPPAQKNSLPRDGCFAVGRSTAASMRPAQAASVVDSLKQLVTAPGERTHRPQPNWNPKAQMQTTFKIFKLQMASGAFCRNALFAAKLSDQQFSLAKLV